METKKTANPSEGVKADGESEISAITILREKLALAEAGISPEWTEGRIKELLKTFAVKKELAQVISAMLKRARTDLQRIAAHPKCEAQERLHTLGGIYWLEDFEYKFNEAVIAAAKSFDE